MRNIDIIFRIIELQKLKPRPIEEKSGMGNSTLKKAKIGDGDLSNENLQKFIDHFQEEIDRSGYKVLENKDPYGAVISKSLVTKEMANKITQGAQEGETLPGLMKVMNRLMETQNEILRDQKENVVSKVKLIESNLNKTHEQVKAAARKQIARTSVMMEALDTLTKNPSGTLLAKSDIIEDALKNADSGDGKITD